TYDAEGEIIAEAPWWHISEPALREALGAFTGTIQQRPPAFSAIKRAGRPLYELARKGEAVEAPLRTVSIHELALLRFAPPAFDLRVVCSSGTYVRSLAHDLGRALGSAAHLTALRRTRVASLTLTEAATLEALEQGGRPLLETGLLPADRAVQHLPAARLDAAAATDVRHGRDPDPSGIRIFAGSTEILCRAYDRAGAFIALLRYDAQHERWRPHKVFLPAPAERTGRG
ncbi:MAG TPA: tRNA pseudouridine(55) synthase TruB, partial [Dehalococcoidia bacterium]|nr:tRNA pseudouridine(55) synthase TruB [Dehalococcoidia bacterium]